MSYAERTGLPLSRRPRTAKERVASAAMLVVFLAVAAAVGSVGLLAFIGQTYGWYPPTPRVSWAPPRGVLQVVRASLLLLVAVGEWLVWRWRRVRPIAGALGLFVAVQVVSTVYPLVFYAGFGVFGLAGLWICAALLLLLDLVVTATVLASWSVSRPAGVLVAIYLPACLLSTALVIGSAGMHAVL